MNPAENQKLQQQVDQLTALMAQEMEGQVRWVNLPDSLPETLGPVPIAMPDQYNGNPDHCQAFIMQCGIFIEEHSERLVEETVRVRFVISLLTGQASD